MNLITDLVRCHTGLYVIITAVREPVRRRILGELCEPRVREHDAVRVLALRPAQAERRARPLHVLLLNTKGYHGPPESGHWCVASSSRRRMLSLIR